MEKIVPANRATLSKKSGCCSTLQYPGNQFLHNKRLQSNERRIQSIQYQDNVVIDLESEEPSREQPYEVSLATTAKKPKILEVGDNNECQMNTCSKRLVLCLRL